MDERIARALRSTSSFESLAQLEKNIGAQAALTPDVERAIKDRATELGRVLISERTGLSLDDLTPAEEKIVQAVSEYAGLMKKAGKDATRTFNQLRNRGFLDSAEVAVAKSKPTQGFVALEDADLKDLSYEQIIIDHPAEFSPRALWFARRTLKLPNETEKPPARSSTAVQARTEELLDWLRELSKSESGLLPRFSNAEAAASIGMTDLQKYGRAFGNIQSRIDFACYRANLPPLGLAAEEPFAKAWNQEDRTWAFPVASMQAAAQSRVWSAEDFARVLNETAKLPGQAHLSWGKETRENEAKIRTWAFGLQRIEAAVAGSSPRTRNPDWTRDELVLALDLYLRFRAAPPSKESAEVAELSALLGRLARHRGTTEGGNFRNANGVYMKMMNFRRHDPEYTADGKVGLPRGNKLEEVVWREFAENAEGLDAELRRIHDEIDEGGVAPVAVPEEAPYWVFVCNPKKWSIDRFLDRRVERDSWGVRPSDRMRFAPGQLGVVRVGLDKRNAAERNGKPPLNAGIYALCEVESEAFDGTGASSEFWADGEGREPGWPTVNLRYIRTYAEAPLTIDRLRAEAPNISPLLLNGFEAASFPLSEADFQIVTRLLGADIDHLPGPNNEGDVVLDQLASLEQKFLRASPAVKARVSKSIERGPIGALVKKANGYRCQLCEALGLNPIGFLKENGEPYVEAHHVTPVFKREIGSLSASNIMTLCANHHRQIHYGGVGVVIESGRFVVTMGERPLHIPRLALVR